MAKLVFDYSCPSCPHQILNNLVDSDAKDDVVCPRCGDTMQRLPPSPKLDWASLAQGDSASPEAIAHFDRVHRQRAAKEAQAKTDHGDYGRAAGAD
jgi:NAD-dependent SIR2 family protein deacetylase